MTKAQAADLRESWLTHMADLQRENKERFERVANEAMALCVESFRALEKVAAASKEVSA